jgi:DNA-3-methyladenine glycosylase II
MRRFSIAGHSMAPTLMPGEEVAATDSRRPAPGDIVVFEHPAREGFWLIKRLQTEDGWVVSDNPEHSESDSRTLGKIPVDGMLAVVARLDETTFVEACDLLAAEEEALRRILGRWGAPDFWHRSPGFPTLVLLILEQQVSLESGASMYRRLAGLVGDVTPESVVTAGDAALRSIGVTRQKAGYLLRLAEDVISGTLDLDWLETAPVSEAREALVSIRGIGPWTADAYLLSALRHPDMWPTGDRALQVGVGETLGMGRAPDETELEMIAEPWRPLRAVAARLIWHAYLSERGRVEPPDPTLVHIGGADA